MNEMPEDNAAATCPANDEMPQPTPRKIFVMRSGARAFAVYADEVEATWENLTPTPLPFAPPVVRGVVSHRGRILTVLDPLLLFPAPTSTGSAPVPAPPLSPTPTPLIVALTGDEQLALAVERVEDAAELFDDQPDMAIDPRSPFRRIIQAQTTAITLLDPTRLFDTAMRGTERRRRRS